MLHRSDRAPPATRTADRRTVSISAWSEGSVVPILAFHAVDEDAGEQSVAPHKFERHMRWLSRVSTPIDLEALGQVLRREVTVRRPVVITFDDGYASIFTAAYPVLRSLNIPFCVFQVTALVGEKGPKPMLTWDQLLAMHDSGLMTIGAHTHTHRRLIATKSETTQWELDQSVDELRRQLGINVRYFAFPYGKYNAASLGEAQARLSSYSRMRDSSAEYPFSIAHSRESLFADGSRDYGYGSPFRRCTGP